MRSAASLPTVTRAAAIANRQRLSSRATITTIGPTARMPSSWAARIAGERASGSPLIASNAFRSSGPTLPERATAAQAARIARPASAVAISRFLRSNPVS